MKRLWFMLVLLPVLARAQQTQTPNIHLNIPPTGTPNWGVLVNQNMVTLDLLLSGNQQVPVISTLQGYWINGNVIIDSQGNATFNNTTTQAVQFSVVPACGKSPQAKEGSIRAVNDLTVTVLGGIVASGGGTQHGLIYCDGTNWSLFAMAGAGGGGGGGGMIFPASGIGNSTGTAWAASYNAGNPIPPTYVSTLNQNTTGNAGTASALSTNGLANQLWGMNAAGTAQGWVNPSVGGGGFTAGGDLSGTSTLQQVVGIRQTPVPALGSGYLHYNGTAFVWDTPSAGGSPQVIVTTGNTPLSVKSPDGNTTLGFTMANGTNPTLTSSTGILGIANLLVTDLAGTGTVLLQADPSGNVQRSTTAPGGGAPTGPAGGDLGGTYPNPTVGGLHSVTIPPNAAGYLHFNGTAFVWDTPSAGGGPPSGPAGGDLGGTYPNPSVSGLLTKALPTLASGYLHYNGTAFVFDTPTGGSFTAGGDLSGTATSQQVIGIHSKAVPTLASGYLHYNGTAFVFDTPAGGFTAGGDLSGTATSQQVVGIHAKAVPALASGYLHYNGTAFVFDTPPSGGSPLWSTLQNPTGDLVLTMGAHITDFSFAFPANGGNPGFTLRDNTNTNPTGAAYMLRLLPNSSNTNVFPFIVETGAGDVLIDSSGNMTIAGGSKLTSPVALTTTAGAVVANAPALGTDGSGNIIQLAAPGGGPVTPAYSQVFQGASMQGSVGPLQLPAKSECSITTPFTCTAVTPTADTDYRLMIKVTQTTPGAGCTTTGSIQLWITYTDPDSNFTTTNANLAMFTVSSGALITSMNMGNAANGVANTWTSMPFSPRVKANTSLSYRVQQTVAAGGCSPDPVFTMRVAMFAGD